MSMLLLTICWCHAAVAMPTDSASLATASSPTPSTAGPTTTVTSDKSACFDDHPTLQHGSYEVAMEIGLVIRPHCNPGFRLVGGEDLVCNEIEQRFMGQESKCEDIDECSLMEDDDDVTNSALSEEEETEDGYDFRSCHQEASCINTFGSYKCVCGELFNGDGFTCSISEEKCHVPEPPSFGVIYPISPQNVRILCHPDYSIHGHGIIKCEGGKWEPLPKCIPGWKSCGDPGVPQNGYRKGNRYHEGASVRFYCRQGYKIQGSRLRMCLEPDLEWTGTQPLCIEIPKESVPKESIEYGGQTPEKPKILHREKRI